MQTISDRGGCALWRMAFWILVRLRRMAEARDGGQHRQHGSAGAAPPWKSREDESRWLTGGSTGSLACATLHPPGPPLCKVGKAFGDHAKTKPIRQVAMRTQSVTGNGF